MDYTIRKAVENDLEVLSMYANNEGMDNIPGIDDVYVAVDGNDSIIGFIRLQNAGDDWYVNPVIVDRAQQGLGIGEKLMHMAHDKYGALKLVSRGWCKGFYDHLGCQVIPWDAIDEEIADECVDCPMKDECGPTPMIMA